MREKKHFAGWNTSQTADPRLSRQHQRDGLRKYAEEKSFLCSTAAPSGRGMRSQSSVQEGYMYTWLSKDELVTRRTLRCSHMARPSPELDMPHGVVVPPVARHV